MAGYERIYWEDEPSTNTPISAENLNKMDLGIANCAAEGAEHTTQIETMDARIDEIIALPDGSTTADAELVDIRVGAGGNTYNSAGTAVRTQIKKLASVSDTQPSDPSNRIWIKGDAEEVEIPTMGELNEVKADLTQLDLDVENLIKTPQETTADLYIVDENGYVIGKFVGGHIVTKNFNSASLPAMLNGKVNVQQDTSDAGKVLTVGSDGSVSPETLNILSDIIKSSNATQSDFDIADANGYVVFRMRNGNIITPEFNSSDTIQESELDSILASKYITNRLRGVKWDALGDSLTAPATVGLSHKNYTRWISEKNGMNLNNLGVGGKGYWQGIEDEVAGIRSDTDIVTIFGSLNDIGNYTTNPGVPTDTWADGKTNYCARARRVFDAILAIRSDIRIGVILPTPWVNYNCYDTASATQENVENMLNALTGICKIYNIPVLDMYHGSNLRPWDSDFRTTYYVAADGYHPNELGNKLFVAPQIEAFLLSLACTY